MSQLHVSIDTCEASIGQQKKTWAATHLPGTLETRDGEILWEEFFAPLEDKVAIITGAPVANLASQTR